MFTGEVSEDEMRIYHEKEYERLTTKVGAKTKSGAKK
jgi:hypothetical protein